MSNPSNGNETTAMALRPEAVTAMAEATGFSVPQIHVVKRALFKGEGDEGDLWLFLTTAKRWNADPFRKEIHAVFRHDSRAGKKVMTIQVGIDQLRRLGKKTGRFRGMVGPYWKAKGKEWTDLWEDDGNPFAAKVGIYMQGCPEPIWGIVKWSEFAQKDRDGRLLGLWGAMPSNQLAKCAEAQAWRKCLEDTDDVQVVEEIPAEDEADQVQAEIQHRRDQTPLTVPRAASPRYHTEQPAAVVVEHVPVEADQPEPSDPVEEAEPAQPPSFLTDMPDRLRLPLQAAAQGINATPMPDWSEGALTQNLERIRRAMAAKKFSEPDFYGLLCSLHLALTGELVPIHQAPDLADGRYIIWLSGKDAQSQYPILLEIAQWWRLQQGEV